jgi:hypothetical protein
MVRRIVSLTAVVSALALAGCASSEHRQRGYYQGGVYQTPYYGIQRSYRWYGRPHRYDPFAPYGYYGYDAWGRPLYYGPGGYWSNPPVYRPPVRPPPVRPPPVRPPPNRPPEGRPPDRPRGPQHHAKPDDRPSAWAPAPRKPPRQAVPPARTPRATAPPRSPTRSVAPKQMRRVEARRASETRERGATASRRQPR